MVDKQRVEYRVVGRKDGEDWVGPEYERLDQVERLAERFRSFGDTDIRIQSRTVIETPWSDYAEGRGQRA